MLREILIWAAIVWAGVGAITVFAFAVMLSYCAIMRRLAEKRRARGAASLARDVGKPLPLA